MRKATPNSVLFSFSFFLILLIGSLFSAQSLGQIADGKCKFLGNVVGNSVPAEFATYWNQVTPENSGKWGSVEATRDVMTWTALDNAYNFAQANNFPFKHHTFVWNPQQPAWLEGLSNEEVAAEVEEWIQAFCERYSGTDYIDVVNEPLNAPAFYRAALGGSGSTGYDWVIWSFEKARQHCPAAKLLLNEYNVINNNSRTDQYITIVNLLKDRGLIDGIGVQGHYFELGNASSSTLTGNLNKLHETGLPVYISEFEVDLASDQEQKTKMETLFPLLWEHPAVQGVTFWGYKQGQIWKPDGYLLRTNNSKRPALTWLEDYVAESSGGGFCFTTGVEDEFKTHGPYPNPVRENGTLTLPGRTKDAVVQVYDIHGNIVAEHFLRKGTAAKINVSVPPGVYLMSLTEGKERTATRLVVH